jgi:hypothetical protein
MAPNEEGALATIGKVNGQPMLILSRRHLSVKEIKGQKRSQDQVLTRMALSPYRSELVATYATAQVAYRPRPFALALSMMKPRYPHEPQFADWSRESIYPDRDQ